MKFALFCVTTIGTAIGLYWPLHPATPPAAAAVGEGAAPALAASSPAAAPAPPSIAPAAIANLPDETVLDRSAGGHFYAVANINGEPIRFMVDTGASTVALTPEDARRAHVDFDPASFQVVGHGATGDVRGQEVSIRDVSLDRKSAAGLRAIVMDGGEVSLLGQNFLRRFDEVEIKGDRMRLR